MWGPVHGDRRTGQVEPNALHSRYSMPLTESHFRGYRSSHHILGQEEEMCTPMSPVLDSQLKSLAIQLSIYTVDELEVEFAACGAAVCLDSR